MTNVIVTPITTEVKLDGKLLVVNTGAVDYIELTTTIPLGANRVVCFESGVLSYASTTSNAEIIGFTKFAATANSTVKIQNTGEQDGFYGLTVGLPVYLADNGLITQTVPTSNRLQCLGVAVSSTKILIQIQPQLTLLNTDFNTTIEPNYVQIGYTE